MSNGYCSPDETMQRLKSRERLALIDVRDQEEFSRNHVLRASNAPLSRLEFMLPLLVPCKKVPIIFMDGGDGDARAGKACERAREMGYRESSCLRGGLADWLEAGYIAVDGTSCMTKSYAEYLEQEMKTPSLTPDEIRQRIAQGEKVALLDIRVPEEYASMAIPEGISAPGCESAYRFLDLVPSPDTLVITNCGSRTRGILCAQMLIDLGVPNPVASMRGGTLNWKLSGYDLEFNRTDRTAPPSFQALAFAREHANMLAQKHDISFVDAAELQAWQEEADKIPLYVFDVRQPEEYAAGHLKGSRCAPGCQLAQLSDDFAAVRNARFVLVDDTEVRSIITAYWLKQLDIPDVHVLRGGLGGSGVNHGKLESLPAPIPGIECRFDKGITCQKIAQKLAEKEPPLLINVGYSDKHRAGHIPGAVWTPRCWLERVHGHYPHARAVVITSDCEKHARLAAADAERLWPHADVRFLKGGTPDWAKKGFELETGMPVSLSAEDDVWYLTYKDPHAKQEAMETFFDWDHALAKKMLADGTCRFRLPK